MSKFRAILSILCPPLAVIDRGCSTIVVVGVLTLLGWFPGAIAALLINANRSTPPQRYIYVPTANAPRSELKKKSHHIRLGDGEEYEVIQDDWSDVPPTWDDDAHLESGSG